MDEAILDSAHFSFTASKQSSIPASNALKELEIKQILSYKHYTVKYQIMFLQITL